MSIEIFQNNTYFNLIFRELIKKLVAKVLNNFQLTINSTFKHVKPIVKLVVLRVRYTKMISKYYKR